jgi:hypothetical protein
MITLAPASVGVPPLVGERSSLYLLVVQDIYRDSFIISEFMSTKEVCKSRVLHKVPRLVGRHVRRGVVNHQAIVAFDTTMWTLSTKTLWPSP